VTAVDTPAPARVEITEPGLYGGVTAEQYHADPVPGGSLTSSGARALLPPSCPALFRHKQLHGEPHKPEWDFGHAAHRLVLGAGAGVVEVEANDWRTNAAKAAKAEAHAAGLVPLLTKDLATVHEMADALRSHPEASALLAPGTGDPEQVVVWQDEDTGVWCRAMFDWLRHRPPTGRRVLVDYKTCASAEPGDIDKAVGNFGYHQQDPWYRDAVRSIDGTEPGFVFIFQERTPPYLVTVAELDPIARRIGAYRNHWARQTYARCLAADDWPPYTTGIYEAHLTRWVENEQGAGIV
jgi:hypothetical protein